MPQRRPYHVAIVGSGPSGYFAAASLLKFADSNDDADVRVDMLEMLPTPWGLVRSGVAPDHPKIKSISAQFEKTATDPRFRFFGNIVVGDHVQATTDIADHALKSLHDRGVEEVLLIGRRGPLQAPFTTLELRELGDLEGLGDVDVIVDPADLADISDEDLEAAGKTVKNNIKVLRGYAEREPRGAKRRIVFRF